MILLLVVLLVWNTVWECLILGEEVRLQLMLIVRVKVVGRLLLTDLLLIGIGRIIKRVHLFVSVTARVDLEWTCCVAVVRSIVAVGWRDRIVIHYIDSSLVGAG